LSQLRNNSVNKRHSVATKVVAIAIATEVKTRGVVAKLESANKDTQSRKWQLTINNPEKHGYTHEFIREILSSFKAVAYWCMADEMGEEKTPHTHIFVAFSSGVRFSSIKKKFPKTHIEMARGTSQQNRDYIFKEGKWEKDKKKDGHIENSREEYGEMPLERQGARNDLNDLYDQLSSGMTIEEIIEDSPQHMLKINQLEKVQQMLREKKFRKTYRELEVTYVHGDTGRGKTRDILEKYDYEVYRIISYENPFDGYKGEDVIVFDEFRNSLKIGDMLKYLEGYPKIYLPARYGDKLACYTKVYIVSNWDFHKQYPEVQKNDAKSWDAFERRIHKIIEYTANGKIEYNVKEMSEEYGKIGTAI
jgi:hypothetical protein